jgi:hypothetical protein
MPVKPAASAAVPPLEKHYTVTEIAQQLNVSDDTVRNLFFDEPGVLKIGEASRLMGGRAKKLKRHYFMLRIPESVLLRVTDRLMHKRPPARSSGVPGRILGASNDDLHAS